jgi:IS5 family transposase
MSEEIIWLYCLCDELLKSCHHVDDSQCKMTDAEVMAFTLTAAIFFYGNYSRALIFFKSHPYFRKILRKSRLNKRILRIPNIRWQQILTICHATLQSEKCRNYIVDSYPIPVCKNERLSRCKIFRDKAFHGYTASKKSYFYGIKAHVLITQEGIPVEVVFTPGSENDMRAFRRMQLDIPCGSTIYADKAYTDYSYEDLLSDTNKKLIAHRKKNAKRQHNYRDNMTLKYVRKRIETTFSVIASLSPRSIHAVTAKGFMLKSFLLILACSLEQVWKATT